jgi:hypothetical protein
MKRKCADCGRTDGIFLPTHEGPLEWLCVPCATRRGNTPENVERTKRHLAEEDLKEHLEGGGRLS